MVYKFFDEKTFGSGIKNGNVADKELVEELHEPIIRNSKKRKVYSSFIDNIWGADLANMQLISKFNKGIGFLVWFIDIFSKYAWVISLKRKKCIAITNTFQKILNESNCKPNKIQLDKYSEFYNRSTKSFLQNNDKQMHNEEKSVVAERFIRTLNNEIYKYMNSMSKNVYNDKLDDIVNKYNNTYHKTIKIKPVYESSIRFM